MEEIWKDIIGYEGLYQVSNLGRIYSTPRPSTKGGIRKTNIDTRGYQYVCCKKFGKGKNLLLHRVIAIHFIPNPENKPQVNHINGNKLDNTIENLEWSTAQENIHHFVSTRKNRSSKYIGVRSSKGKWEVFCTVNKARKHIGYFLTEEEAHEAHINFLKENNIVNKYALK